MCVSIGYTQDFGCYSTPTSSNGYSISRGVYNTANQDSLFWIKYETPLTNDGYHKSMWNKYQVKMEGEIIDGKKEGLWTIYLKGGNAFYRLNYLSNLKDGTCEKYLMSKSDTILSMKGYYKNDLKEGKFMYFHKKDTIISYFENYSEGKLNGISKDFHFSRDNTKYLGTINNYNNGKKDGIEKRYKLDKNDIPYLYEISEYINGKQIGKEIIFSSTGDTIRIEDYSSNEPYGSLEYLKDEYNGKWLISFIEKNGITKHYNFSWTGDTTSIEIYEANKRISKYFTLDSLDNIWKIDRKINYYNDKSDFNYEKYYNNGQLAFKILFKDSLLYTAICAYSIEGDKLDVGTLKDGNGIFNCFYSNGKLKSSYSYENSICVGKIFNYFQNGDIKINALMYKVAPKAFSFTKYTNEGNDINLYYLDNNLYGKIDCFYKNTSKRSEIVYDTTNSITSFKYYFDNNSISTIFTMLDNEKIGKYYSYYRNGNLEIEENYKNISKGKSVKDGVWNYYFEDGKLKSSIHYNKGKKEGESKYYDETGLLRRVEVIENNGENYSIFDGDTVNYTDTNGLKHGKWITLKNSYYQGESICNDIPNSIRYYKNDKPIGIWEEKYRFYHGTKKIVWLDSTITYIYIYNDDNILIEEGEMVDAEMKFGIWKEYQSENGFLSAKGQYFYNEKIGVWEIYKKNGKLKKVIDYSKNKSKR